MWQRYRTTGTGWGLGSTSICRLILVSTKAGRPSQSQRQENKSTVNILHLFITAMHMQEYDGLCKIWCMDMIARHRHAWGQARYARSTPQHTKYDLFRCRCNVAIWTECVQKLRNIFACMGGKSHLQICSLTCTNSHTTKFKIYSRDIVKS